jgi:hypothetical protein
MERRSNPVPGKEGFDSLQTYNTKCFLANPFVKTNGEKQLGRIIANREVSDPFDPTVQIGTGHKKPRSPDQGKRKMGANGLEKLSLRV